MVTVSMLKILSIAALSVLTTSALADIYAVTDANGNRTYTNFPMKGAVKVEAKPLTKKQEAEIDKLAKTLEGMAEAPRWMCKDEANEYQSNPNAMCADGTPAQLIKIKDSLKVPYSWDGWIDIGKNLRIHQSTSK